MDNIKVNLNITLRGRIMLSQEEADALEKQHQGEGYNKESVTIGFKKKDRETFYFKTRKGKFIQQSINIGKEAYDYMTDKHSCPEWEKPKAWIKMNRIKRLESHLQRLTEHFNGTSYTYEIFED